MLSGLIFALGSLLICSLLFRQSWAAQRRRTARRKRRERREQRLDDYCCHLGRHDALSTLVDQLDEVSPDVVEAQQLDWLLERHAQLLIDRRRLMDALSLPPRPVRPGATAARVAVHDAESAWRAACAHSIFNLSDQLAALEELVRLYCERAVMPDFAIEDDREDPIERTFDLFEAREEAGLETGGAVAASDVR